MTHSNFDRTHLVNTADRAHDYACSPSREAPSAGCSPTSKILLPPPGVSADAVAPKLLFGIKSPTNNLRCASDWNEGCVCRAPGYGDSLDFANVAPILIFFTNLPMKNPCI